ncbi:MAG TPA: PaaI family thioesterase [Acidimicrobiales bacterium]|nr:PaaI family thioesterase [Acidimicrobiales bacterium]
MGWAPRLQWSVEPPGLVSVFEPSAGHSGRPGFVHGGLAATLLDETMAGLSWATDGIHSVTATLSLRYRVPVPLGAGALRMEAWYDDARPRRVRKVHGRLLLPDGTAAVEATGLFVRVSDAAGDDGDGDIGDAGGDVGDARDGDDAGGGAGGDQGTGSERHARP